MKFLPIVALSLALLTASCALVPAPYAAQLKPIAKRYNSVASGAPRAEVEAQLGSPIREEKEGVCVWETRLDELNYARVKVWFDVENKAHPIEVTQAHGTSRPGYQASAVSTRAR